MELIVISHPEKLEGEADVINTLFTEGLSCLHLRKPGYSEEQLADLLSEIEPAWREHISLHQHHTLAGRFGIRRLHFTETARNAVSSQHLAALYASGFILSTSTHDPETLRTLPECFSYIFLGPVFDSISKEGYRAAMPKDFKLERSGFPGKVIALGGIDHANLALVRDMGFDGAAALGTIWQKPKDALAQLRRLYAGLKPGGWDLVGTGPGLKPGVGELSAGSDGTVEPDGGSASAQDTSQRYPTTIDRLHFISNETETMSHIDSVRLALEAGCRWIQLRVKNRTEEEVLPLAWEATRLCDSYAAKLIINDFPRIAQAVEAYGLHLGLTDTPVPEARALVGDDMIIGGTANTWEDIALRIGEGADYIGLGPFRFTSTKQNLSPVVGEAGYHALLTQMANKGQSIPIIAIGGILPDDIPILRSAGVYGVAMSAAIISADDPKETVHQIQQALC